MSENRDPFFSTFSKDTFPSNYMCNFSWMVVLMSYLDVHELANCIVEGVVDDTDTAHTNQLVSDLQFSTDLGHTSLHQRVDQDHLVTLVHRILKIERERRGRERRERERETTK